MLEELMRLADEYADCRGAEDCGADPRWTVKAREDLKLALIKALQNPAKNPAI